MRKLYPKSFHTLVLAGFLLVLVPLLVAVMVTVHFLEEAVSTRQEGMSSSALLSEVNGEIGLLLGEMREEMALIVAQSPRSSELLSDFKTNNTRLIEQLQLNKTVSGEVQTGNIERVQERLKILAEDLNAGADASLLRGQFIHVDEETIQVLKSVSDRVDASNEHLSQQARKLRWSLFGLLMLAGVFSIFMLLMFRKMISASIRDIDLAIRQIGRSDFIPEVCVDGQPDFPDLNRRLEWLKRRLQTAEEQRTRMMRHLSHDLKTPLTAICEGSQLLAEGAAGPLDERQKPLVHIVNQNAKRLQHYIEDLINYQQIMTARFNLEFQTLRMDRLVESVLGSHIMAAGKHNVRFKRSMPELEIVGDKNKVFAIVDNLISNAIKFSPDDGIVTVNLEEHHEGIALDVIDQGPGIPKDERGKIFDPFFRGVNTKGMVKGSGLGLAIAHDYARVHNGNLELLEDAAGAHFRLTLPVNATESPVTQYQED